MASFANCFRSVFAHVSFSTNDQKSQILSCDSLVANERCIITPENHKEYTWYKREELNPTDGM